MLYAWVFVVLLFLFLNLGGTFGYLCMMMGGPLYIFFFAQNHQPAH